MSPKSGIFPSNSVASVVQHTTSLHSNYPAPLKDYGGEILLVGVSYHPKSHEHKCVIEAMDTSTEAEPKP